MSAAVLTNSGALPSAPAPLLPAAPEPSGACCAGTGDRFLALSAVFLIPSFQITIIIPFPLFFKIPFNFRGIWGQ